MAPTSDPSVAQREATAWEAIQAAKQRGQLTASAVENIRAWLTLPYYAEFRAEILRHVDGQLWRELDDAFWTTIPFGTGGRRGRMYPIGSNTINDRTIGESAQGLADYVRALHPQARPGELSCAMAYDTRHRSRHFAELCSEVLAAAGFRIYFLDGYRSTPALSTAVRHLRCQAGIMVTASHNPPADNAVKVYWSTGGQLLPPHDRGVIECVQRVQTIERLPFDAALAAGQIVYCQDEIDAVFLSGVLSQSVPGPRELKVLYSPMHGVGAQAVVAALHRDGFDDVEIYAPHAEPDGDFPNVPDHVANPENPRTFDGLIARAEQGGHHLAISNDPDADRLGAAARLQPDGPLATLAGNPLGALLVDFVLQSRQRTGALQPGDYIVATLVTSRLVRRIGQSYGVRVIDDLLVGFKWIAGVIDDVGPEHFVCACEESHGFQAGTYARDKDGAVAALLLAELAAECQAQGRTLHQRLQDLWLQHGCHLERTLSIPLPGAEGMAKMQALMERLRTHPPQRLAGLDVVQRRDYERLIVHHADGRCEPLAGPRGDLVFFDLSVDGNAVAVRPSGTEPKIKLYLFGYEAPVAVAELAASQQRLEDRLTALAADVQALAAEVV